MRLFTQQLAKATGIFAVLTLLCGVLYPLLITGIGQGLFRSEANASIIEVGGTKYGSSLIGQPFNDDKHMWGRISTLDASTFTDANGKPLLYGQPTNANPSSEEYRQLVAQRVEKLRAANPDVANQQVPVDLVTASGSGLDPHISPAAAQYQVPRLVKATGKTEAEVKKIIEACTEKKFLGIFGEERVNVLRVNLMLDGVLNPSQG